VGMDNHNDHLLEQLADKGDGLCNYVDDEQEVRRALVDNFTGAFEAIARDVKLQVEFDPAQVSRYRLLGYENRAIADADFRNDKVDAGEIGAGHQVVALYEIARTLPADPAGPLATVRLRYKDPYVQGVADRNEETAAREIAQSIGAKDAAGAFAATSAGYRRAVLVAQLAEFLRRSVHARTDSLDRLLLESRALASELQTTEFGEFVGMVEKSHALVAAEIARRDRFDDCGDLIRRNCYLRRQIEEARRLLGENVFLEDLEQRSRELERRLGELRLGIEGAEFKVAPAFVVDLERENAELERQLQELIRRLRLK
jgi:Ca-activated chloride channel family protein